MSNDKKRFVEIFGGQTICIPVLQRDYAQGRREKKYIRVSFLKQLIEAVVDKKEITLDFIYGYDSSNNQKFYPLDGQQRLTTVWLLYWFLAAKAGCLTGSKDNPTDEMKLLQRFSYETRMSSRDFCDALATNYMDLKDCNAVDYIKNQTWFYSAWKNDPTVGSMLITIGGTAGNDGIEPILEKKEVFKKKQKQEYKAFLKNLTDSISFYVLKIGSEELPSRTADQLYIKMNARGKALTDFENFKADLVEHVKGREFTSEVFDNKNLCDHVSHELDLSWNDMFWENTPSVINDGKTDEVFFSFLNRYCLNQICIKKDAEGNDALVEKFLNIFNESSSINTEDEESDEESAINYKEDEENSKADDGKGPTEAQINAVFAFNYLKEDCNLSYENFDNYKDVFSPEMVRKLSSVMKALSNQTVMKDVNDCLAYINTIVGNRGKDDAKYSIIPKYAFDKDDSSKKITKIDKAGNTVGKVVDTSEKERLYFFAICKYFEINCDKYSKDTFGQWMRVTRNIIENSGIDSVKTMIKCMRTLENYGNSSSCIIDRLANDKASLEANKNESRLSAQLYEESQKAAYIKEDYVNNLKKIIDAEDYDSLCGCIRFLFTDGKGDPDWSEYDKKMTNLKSFVNNNVVSTDFVKNYDLMFVDFYDISKKLVFHNIMWKKRGDCWLDILCGDQYDKTHKALLKTSTSNATGELDALIKSNSFKEIVEKKGVLAGKANLRINWYSGANTYALYKKNAQDAKLCLDYQKYFSRNSLLSQLDSYSAFKIGPNHLITSGEDYYWGDDILFSVNNKSYLWTSKDDIYDYNENRKRKGSKLILANASKSTASQIIAIL